MALTQITGSGIGNVTSEQQKAQTFLLQADQSGAGAAETLTNWGEATNDYTRVGTSNWSESAGIFSSATTGTFLCLYNLSIESSDAQDAFDTRIEISTNSGSSFTARAVAYTTGGNNSGPHMAISNQFIFTVSNATTFRLRMRLGEVNSVATQNEIMGDSNQAETSITFVKLGVI